MIHSGWSKAGILGTLGVGFVLATSPSVAGAASRADIATATATQEGESAGYAGVVASRHAVSLIALVAGRVKAVHANAGQRVRKGQALVELEPQDFRARLDAADSRAATARAVAAEARSEFERYARVADKGVISAQMLDKVRARALAAEAAAAEAEAGAREARTQFGYTVLRSPIDGLVTDKHVEPGDFTQPGLPSEVGFPSGRTLMSVYDPHVLRFEARIPQRFATRLHAGDAVRVEVPAAGKSLEAVLAEVMPAVDEVSRTFIVRANLAADPALQPGMTGSLRFATGERGVVTVPAAALVERGQLDAVFVLKTDGRVSLRLVRPGKRTGDRVEILSGIAAGERMVLQPRATLRDGDAP